MVRTGLRPPLPYDPTAPAEAQARAAEAFRGAFAAANRQPDGRWSFAGSPCPARPEPAGLKFDPDDAAAHAVDARGLGQDVLAVDLHLALVVERDDRGLAVERDRLALQLDRLAPDLDIDDDVVVLGAREEAQDHRAPAAAGGHEDRVDGCDRNRGGEPGAIDVRGAGRLHRAAVLELNLEPPAGEGLQDVPIERGVGRGRGGHGHGSATEAVAGGERAWVSSTAARRTWT